MWRFLREYWRMLKTSEGRQAIVMALFRETPGKPGLYVRGVLHSKAFATCGENLSVLAGFRVRNPGLLRVGSNVYLGEQAFLQAGGGLELGDDVLIGPGVKIWTQTHLFADPDTPVWRQGAEFKPVVIGDDCWLGSDCFIMPGTVLGRGCVVSAGAVVGAKKYPDFSILMGNPARVIGSRKPKPAVETPVTDT